MLDNLRERVTLVLHHIELQLSPSEDLVIERPRTAMVESHEDPAFPGAGDEPMPPVAAVPLHVRKAAAVLDPEDPSTWGRVSRNSPCPCGTGKKYKHCHGRLA
jgi:preprotein translocase subunit SecA